MRWKYYVGLACLFSALGMSSQEQDHGQSDRTQIDVPYVLMYNNITIFQKYLARPWRTIKACFFHNYPHSVEEVYNYSKSLKKVFSWNISLAYLPLKYTKGKHITLFSESSSFLSNSLYPVILRDKSISFKLWSLLGRANGLLESTLFSLQGNR